ncbi:GntR family transcriptional regulator [Devosia sp. ZB163]|uniref:GntR family transcriptional regulator n=1 Tax=Devosia sp. ZB163 TaxID=3025938 RepID=UPI002362789D|nr:GntR family transcriptional regulator [Devosia sp. ZB163]MDC9822216.1 GntR family transcriptional regulator [Devosia sp. ZB163]
MQHVRVRPLLPDVVRAELRRLIIGGEFPPGSRLPNEDALCTRFSVSRITLREAVRGLIEDGYVTRRQGSGTYVNEGPALRNSLDTNFSYTDYLESIGVKASREVLDVCRTPASDTVALELGLPLGSEVVVVRRVRSADGKPAIYSVDSLPVDLADAERDADRFTGSIYRLLSERGHDIDHARAVVLPVIADSELATILQVPEGTPLQHLKQIDHDTANRPVMHSLEWHVPSVIELRVYRRGPGRVQN